MLLSRSIATSLAIVLSAAPLWAQLLQVPKQTPSGPPPIRETPVIAASSSSSWAAARFWEIGYEIAHSGNITGPVADQAIILLTAAKSLDSRSAGIEPLLLKLATRHADKDYSEPVVFWLEKYVDPSADRLVVADAIRGVLNRLNSPTERKTLLETLALKIKNKNPAIDSDLATLLGLLVLEQGDAEQARWYMVQAYNNNKFNRTAFAKLTELAPNEIGSAANLEHLRLLVRENPLDLNAALSFAAYAERLGLYEVAALSYQYCAELFRYLYPSEPLPQHIYLPWAISCYNAPQGLQVCLQIAENIRGLKRFDMLLDAIAGKAALKLGKPEVARQIFDQTQQKAQELLSSGSEQAPTAEQADAKPVRPATAKQLAWFYSFADSDPAKALDWANKAYSAEPNSSSAGALLAYALTINNQLEYAKPLLASSEQSQILDLARARVQLAAGNKPDAIQTIRAVIAKDASSLVAEKAKELLRELGSAYTPSGDARVLAAFLAERLGKTVVPRFLPPDQMMGVQFSVRGTDFSYGKELEGVIAVANKFAEPLVITDNSLFQGNIRVSARVAGDIKREIPNLVSETIRTDLAVVPGKGLVHTLRLSTGELRDILLTYPQANLEIQFTLYLDPVATEAGGICNRLVDVKPVTITIKRPRAQITGDYVRSRVNAITSAPEAQRIQTALLFTGLLKEQHVMAEQGVLYAFQYQDWLPGQLRLSLTGSSGLLLGGTAGEWAAKVNTMADMLSMPLDQELAAVVLKNLECPQWPVRLMAVYLLAKGSAGSVGAVLDWVAQNDKDELVRSMAISLQAASATAPAPLWSAPQSALTPQQ
ncbi:MAG: hypothetical protein NTZ17_18015 [Phycisphaerae bacterium]|nr:hypothetical protein [Phycisphaerae bacterium]